MKDCLKCQISPVVKYGQTPNETHPTARPMLGAGVGVIG